MRTDVTQIAIAIKIVIGLVDIRGPGAIVAVITDAVSVTIYGAALGIDRYQSAGAGTLVETVTDPVLV